MHTRIKICGVRDRDTALVAAACGADAIGLVFVDTSPRVVDLAQARSIVSALPALVEPIALFSNALRQTVLDVTGELGLRTVQLHGDEPPEYVESLKPLRVIKSVPAADSPQLMLERLNQWANPSANLCGLLVDAPPQGTLTGGSGKTFDWSSLHNLHQRGLLETLPVLILAGGLNAENVSTAIRIAQPYAVDVSSGVESSRGVKNPELIHAFCKAVRKADMG